MSSADATPVKWFDRATTNTARDARRAAWRKHPRRMFRRAIRRPTSHRPPSDQPTSNEEVLERLRSLPIGFWTYSWEDASVRHMGPMAQDFWEAFGLGGTPNRIHSVDAHGVLIAAVQVLIERVEELEADVAELKHNAGAPPPPESPTTQSD